MQTSVKNFGKAEHAIHQRRVTEDQLNHYGNYTRELHAIRRNAEWHETKEKFAVAKKNKANEIAMDQELEEANSELKILRNKRLQELYQKEW